MHIYLYLYIYIYIYIFINTYIIYIICFYAVYPYYIFAGVSRTYDYCVKKRYFG